MRTAFLIIATGAAVVSGVANGIRWLAAGRARPAGAGLARRGRDPRPPPRLLVVGYARAPAMCSRGVPSC
jgi:hypothetical protein